MSHAIVEHDVDNGCLYLRASTEPVARTVSVADLVMVDLDSDGQVVGVELAMDTRRWRRGRETANDTRTQVLSECVAALSALENPAIEPFIVLKTAIDAIKQLGS